MTAYEVEVARQMRLARAGMISAFRWQGAWGAAAIGCTIAALVVDDPWDPLGCAALAVLLVMHEKLRWRFYRERHERLVAESLVVHLTLDPPSKETV